MWGRKIAKVQLMQCAKETYVSEQQGIFLRKCCCSGGNPERNRGRKGWGEQWARIAFMFICIHLRFNENEDDHKSRQGKHKIWTICGWMRANDRMSWWLPLPVQAAAQVGGFKAWDMTLEKPVFEYWLRCGCLTWGSWEFLAQLPILLQTGKKNAF